MMTKMKTAAGLLLAAAPLFACARGVAQTTTPALSDAQTLQLLDPDMLSVVLLFDAIKGTPDIYLSPQDARQQIPIQTAANVIARGIGTANNPAPVGKVTDGMTFTNRSGVQIPIRIYTPAGSGPFPVVLYFHGGGFVLATIDTYDASARALCAQAKAIVVSVEYRKAPEVKAPGQRMDAVDAYKWVLANIGNYGGDEGKVAVAGESAGGNLATLVAIVARDQGLQMPSSELLIYPEVSGNLSQTSDLEYTSSQLPLYTPFLKWLDGYYLASPSQTSQVGISPILDTLKGLPPTTIIAAQVDPLFSDGQAYYKKLKSVGNNVTYREYTGVTHEFFGLGAVVAKAAQAEAFAAQQLDASF